MAGRTVLVLTRQADVTADLVIRELARRGVAVFRCDVAEFPARLVLAGELREGRWSGGLRVSRRGLDLAEVGAVYYRRPTGFRFAPGMTEENIRWARREALLGVGGVLASLPAVWVNHPHDLARAEYKPWQLTEACAVGLSPPRTLITNDPRRARAFAESLPGGVVYKPLSGPPTATPPVTLFTTRLATEQCGEPGVAATAHLFQEWIDDKAFEVRLMVVGERVFAARIDAASDVGRVDWRADAAALTYTCIQPPAGVQAGAVALVARLGLRYGALDFAVTADGRWVFFEINPAGQWAWIPQVRQPITAAIADMLQDAAT